MKNIIRTRIYESPCGSLLLGSYGDRLCLCDWLAGRRHAGVERRLERLLQAGFVEETSPVTDERRGSWTNISPESVVRSMCRCCLRARSSRKRCGASC